MARVTLDLDIDQIVSDHFRLGGVQDADALKLAVIAAGQAYPWKERVESAFHDALTRRINEYFTAGQGAVEINAAALRILTAANLYVPPPPPVGEPVEEPVA